jgi:hypothetical protein
MKGKGREEMTISVRKRLERQALKEYNIEINKIPLFIQWADAQLEIGKLWVSENSERKYNSTNNKKYLSLYLSLKDTYDKEVLLFLDTIKEKYPFLNLTGDPSLGEQLISYSVTIKKVWIGDLDFYIPKEGACSIVVKETKSNTHEIKTIVCG